MFKEKIIIEMKEVFKEISSLIGRPRLLKLGGWSPRHWWIMVTRTCPWS